MYSTATAARSGCLQTTPFMPCCRHACGVRPSGGFASRSKQTTVYAFRNLEPSTRIVKSNLLFRTSKGVSRTKHVCRAVESTTGHKLISKTEIPAFIQRGDLMQQMLRWATIETGENCVRQFGLPMVVSEQMTKQIGEDTILWGFKVSIFREGAKLGELGIVFDDTLVQKHEWIDRDQDGFPVGGGRATEVRGKNFEIWKMDANPVDDQQKTAIRGFCTSLVSALTKYYSFGSVFSEEI